MITDKQKKRIERLITHIGDERVKEYFYDKFPNGKFDSMTKAQAQKVITGLQWNEPRKPIHGVMNYYL